MFRAQYVDIAIVITRDIKSDEIEILYQSICYKQQICLCVIACSIVSLLINWKVPRQNSSTLKDVQTIRLLSSIDSQTHTNLNSAN